MTYPPILPGVYGCSPGKGWTGWETRRWTQSPFGHSFMAMPDRKVIEATGKGVVLSPVEKYLDQPGVVWNNTEPLTDAFRARCVIEACKLLGRPYDYKVNVDIAASLLFGIKSPFLPAGDKGSFNCSQLVTVIYTEAGFAMFPLVDRWRISPRMLADRITEHVWLKGPE